MLKRLSVLILIVTGFCMLIGGCASIGPGSLNKDRFDYTRAMADSWKRQMLLNIVKIRYGDAPIFLDVTSITNQYSLETELRGTLGWAFPPQSNRQELGGTSRYYDRPTITYSPLTGEKFARSLMTPIAPATVMTLVEGGYPIDLVFRVLVHSVNGINNQFGGSARMRRADPEFYLLLEQLREIQNKGAAGLKIKTTKDNPRGTLVMVFRKLKDNRELPGKEIRRMLGLNDKTDEFSVVYGTMPSNDQEIALLTRSIIEILSDISSTIEVPAAHVDEKRAPPTVKPEGEGIKGALIHILYAEDEPRDAFAAVPYRGRWFWIDDKDYQSKKLFSFLMFVMTLTETGGKEGAPVLTISAGG
ncbi:MAG: hypothetical protein JW902_17280 [Syntrophaceae bacterium]|nr:hypothetical protein [Syntrophaceae bacterium]